MQGLEIVREKIQNHYRVAKTDEDLEWNRAIDLCANIINAHLSRENVEKIARQSRDTDLRRAIEILDKLSFFGGQRAGRELWNDKPREAQDEDIASFNRDIKWLRDFIRNYMNDGWIPVEERLPEVDEDVEEIIEDDDCPEYNVTIRGASESTTLKYSPNGSWFDSYGCVYDVIAWQPLPEPYKPKQPETCKYTGGSCCWPIDQCKECPNYAERSEVE